MLVAVAAIVQLSAPGSGFIAVFSGLVLVLGGTLLAARLSHSDSALKALTLAVRSLRAPAQQVPGGRADRKYFFEAAKCFRYGKIRPAEAITQHIQEPVLRRGTQLVLDGFPREQVMLALQRQIAEQRDHYRRPVDLIRSMSNYAPTLGMLGTLLGLVQMLFGLSAGEITTVGTSMGFAMLTTVYGLTLSNLALKPMASKLEQLGRLRLNDSLSQMQAVMLLYDRHHAEVIREVMEQLEPQWLGQAASKPQLAVAGG
jgi:chemotaxis protein MotA